MQGFVILNNIVYFKKLNNTCIRCLVTRFNLVDALGKKKEKKRKNE